MNESYLLCNELLITTIVSHYRMKQQKHDTALPKCKGLFLKKYLHNIHFERVVFALFVSINGKQKLLMTVRLPTICHVNATLYISQ